MAYTRRQAEWKNYPNTTTPIRAEDLNAIEDGLVDAAGVADTALDLASTAAARAANAEALASAAVARDANPTMSVTYNPDGTVATSTTNGITTSYTYNFDGTIATATVAGVSRTFTYDGSGNVTGAI